MCWYVIYCNNKNFHNCDHFIEQCKNGAVSLTHNYYGMVLVCVKGVWHTICRQHYWHNAEASVICRQLGYSPYGKV